MDIQSVDTSAAAQAELSPIKPRGFATMNPKRVREIASMGGKAAHAQGKAHEWTPEEARIAGRKGGQSSRGAKPLTDF